MFGPESEKQKLSNPCNKICEKCAEKNRRIHQFTLNCQTGNNDAEQQKRSKQSARIKKGNNKHGANSRPG